MTKYLTNLTLEEAIASAPPYGEFRIKLSDGWVTTPYTRERLINAYKDNPIYKTTNHPFEKFIEQPIAIKTTT